jgi:hypothetical protein
VDLAELRGWAGQVERAGEDCAGLAAYVGTYVPDGDFGRILGLVSADYEAYVGRARGALEVEASRLERAGGHLRASATAYAETDARVARTLGWHGAVADPLVARAPFRDSRPLAEPPVAGGQALPEVSFGWVFDKACEVIVWAGGPDLRRDVTDQVTGDLGKVGLQADAWEQAAGVLTGMAGDLAHGSTVIARSWEGRAADSSARSMDERRQAVEVQGAAMARVAAYLRDLATQALAVAQVVVDCVEEICTLVGAIVTGSTLPGYAELRLARSVPEIVALAVRARGVLAAFWRYLVCVKDGIRLAAESATAATLPAAA